MLYCLLNNFTPYPTLLMSNINPQHKIPLRKPDAFRTTLFLFWLHQKHPVFIPPLSFKTVNNAAHGILTPSVQLLCYLWGAMQLQWLPSASQYPNLSRRKRKQMTSTRVVNILSICPCSHS